MASVSASLPFLTSVNIRSLVTRIDESTAECDASVRKPRDFNVMHMSSCSFEAHMPQNYFQKMNEKAERGWKIGRLGRRGET